MTDWDDTGQLWRELSYVNVMKNNKTVIVPAYSHRTNITNNRRKKVSEYVIANLNSIAQEGEFVCNGTLNMPLEDVWNKDTRKFLSCIDIHKGLYDYILTKYLKVDSIESARRKYYPNEHDLALRIQSEALSL